MLRRLARVLFLAICLNLLMGMASEPNACAVRDSQRLPSILNPQETETAVSPISPAPQSGNVVPDLDLSGFLAHPLLVTSEPALIQLHLEDLAHETWQRFGLADVAPFGASRSLPIQT